MVALVADHFGPRGIERICERDRGQMVERRERRRDTFGALEYLRKRADVDPGRIAVMGMSDGGSATINAAIPGLNDPQDLRFKAAIALYPDCVGYAGLKLDTPLLILIGERDDWTPAADCRDLIERLPKESAPARMEVFPKAEHSFDDEAQQTMYLARVLNSHAWTRYGATVGYQAAARSEAVRLVREFLQQRLAPAPPR
jgi:dienelactone hydrolase